MYNLHIIIFYFNKCLSKMATPNFARTVSILIDLFQSRIHTAVFKCTLFDIVITIGILLVVNFDSECLDLWFRKVSVYFCDRIWILVTLQTLNIHIIGRHYNKLFGNADQKLTHPNCHEKLSVKLRRVFSRNEMFSTLLFTVYASIKFAIAKNMFQYLFDMKPLETYMMFKGPFIGELNMINRDRPNYHCNIFK